MNARWTGLPQSVLMVIEQGSVAEIFDRPQQAYTRDLLDAAFGGSPR
jgi:ABC-type microcin C transport system duplicated ATPase subunit YejF